MNPWRSELKDVITPNSTVLNERLNEARNDCLAALNQEGRAVRLVKLPKKDDVKNVLAIQNTRRELLRVKKGNKNILNQKSQDELFRMSVSNILTHVQSKFGQPDRAFLLCWNRERWGKYNDSEFQQLII